MCGHRFYRVDELTVKPLQATVPLANVSPDKEA